MDRSARPCRPLGHFTGRRAGRGVRRLLSPQARNMDRDLAAALLHRARGTAERRYVGRWRAVRQRHALVPLARHRGERRHRRIRPVRRFTPRSASAYSPFSATRRCRPAMSSNRAWCCRAGASCSASVAPAAIRFASPRSWHARSTTRKNRASSCGAGALSTLLRAEVHDLKNGAQRDLGRVDWIDAQSQGRCAVERKRETVPPRGPHAPGHGDRCRAEARRRRTDMTFEAVEAPKRALRWP